MLCNHKYAIFSFNPFIRHSMTHTNRKYICKFAVLLELKVLNIIYKEKASQSLFTNTLYFIYSSSCDDKYSC